MSRVCAICGKGPRAGRSIVRRGLAKKKGGVGRKTTGISKRRFLPNLQTVKIEKGGKIQKIKVCTSCLSKGKVKKVV
ncbi:MAG: 50S ribosomal protein L28 [Candidatus Omnitrophica bacterium 4484_49]|nr:50S ribosomal protein L28 [Candidatus Omnitrophota bacterium]OQX83805.1 MAG: 50S ribosomal protein L28 [Candidatus Omnitrophica bacterium 4484_49]RKY36118.1 MAG: 50S ribosomal protein L28 [Candidatus Omnitrophota bacterium]